MMAWSYPRLLGDDEGESGTPSGVKWRSEGEMTGRPRAVLAGWRGVGDDGGGGGGGGGGGSGDVRRRVEVDTA